MSIGTPQASPARYSMAFFDAQNLFRHAKNAFQETPDDNYHHPNFDPKRLHAKVADKLGFKPNLTRFYSGVPLESDHELWGGYWASRKLALTRAGVAVTTRRLRYHTEQAADGTTITVPQEKGIDIRIALDLVTCARRKEFDAAIIFSQDQDLGEAVLEVWSIAKEQGRSLEIFSAFPTSDLAISLRGIATPTCFPMDKAFYDTCIERRDYRPAKFRPGG